MNIHFLYKYLLMRIIRLFIIGIFAVALLSAQSTDKPSTHGMLLVGGRTDTRLYASHLPMFHSPHDYQVLLEMKFPDSIHALYTASLKKFPKEMVYTIEPEVFVLPDMIAKPRPFKVHLYRGHFERGGTKIAENVVVEIANVLHFRKFDPAAKRPATAEYLLFGTAEEPFIAHTIAAKPDFDQILSIKPHTALKTVLSPTSAVPLIAQNLANKPLKAGQQIQAKTSSNNAVSVSVLQSLYCEFGDLK